MISFNASKGTPELKTFFGDDKPPTNPGLYYKDLKKDGTLVNNALAVKRLLWDGKPHSLKEVMSVGGGQYGARVYELRHGKLDGFKYTIKNFRENGTTYFQMDGYINMAKFDGPEVLK